MYNLSDQKCTMNYGISKEYINMKTVRIEIDTIGFFKMMRYFTKWVECRFDQFENIRISARYF